MPNMQNINYFVADRVKDPIDVPTVSMKHLAHLFFEVFRRQAETSGEVGKRLDFFEQLGIPPFGRHWRIVGDSNIDLIEFHFSDQRNLNVVDRTFSFSRQLLPQ